MSNLTDDFPVGSWIFSDEQGRAMDGSGKYLGYSIEGKKDRLERIATAAMQGLMIPSQWKGIERTAKQMNMEVGKVLASVSIAYAHNLIDELDNFDKPPTHGQ